MSVNVAVVGLGFMGVTHIKAYRKIEGVRIAAICDAYRLPLDGDLSKISGNMALGEAITLAANQLVLRDMGRTPRDEVAGKPIGSVHGDSIGVHACDSVAALYCLTKSMIATPCGPSAVPTGGAGVALPAGIWILTIAATFFFAMTVRSLSCLYSFATWPKSISTSVSRPKMLTRTFILR